MTVSQTIACAIGVAAVITGLALTIRHTRRKPVRWWFDGNVITFDEKLTEEQVEEFKAEWKRQYGHTAGRKGSPMPDLYVASPLAARARLRAQHHIDSLGAWLCGHGCTPLAGWLWRAFRML
ncbi:hypothetical protein [Streptomyces chartreusis]